MLLFASALWPTTLFAQHWQAGEDPGVPGDHRMLDRIFARVQRVTEEELDRLVAEADRTVALAAAWERVRRTVPEGEIEEAVQPALLALGRFLGVVEGRVRTPLPEWWAEAIAEARSYGRAEGIWFPFGPMAIPEDMILPYRQVESPPSHVSRLRIIDEHEIELRLPADLSIEQREGAWWLKRGDNECRLPPEAMRERPALAEVLNAGLDAERCYVALHGTGPFGYTLTAIARETGDVIWKAEVSAGGFEGGATGLNWHWVDIRVIGDEVILFGNSGTAAYVEAFDTETGEVQMRFGTELYAPSSDASD